MGDLDLSTVRVQQNTLPYLGLVIIRSRHDPAENLHSLRQLHYQIILGLVSLLLLGLEHRYSLQLTVVVRIVRVVDNTRLEVLCSNEESDETK